VSYLHAGVAAGDEVTAPAHKQPFLRRLDMRPADLNETQRALYVSMRAEASKPTIKLSYGRFCLALLVSSAISLVVGMWVAR
jgi:hypothetical protein